MDAIHIIGAGGIGCVLGAALSSSGRRVAIIESNERKIASGRAAGVAVEGRGTWPADFIHFAEWRPPPLAIVLLCTKCYDNAAVLDCLPPDARVVPVQNGFDPLLEQHGHEAEGIASFVSECAADRPHTRITRRGALHLGPRDAPMPAWLESLAVELRRVGWFRVVTPADIRPFKYAKLMYNAAIGPLAASAGLDNGDLLRIPLARRLFFEMLRENYSILTGAGKPLGKVGPFHPSTVMAILNRRWLARALASAFYPSLRGSYCSMSADIATGRTEIGYYNQRLVDWAGTRPCPLNRRAVEVVRSMERGMASPHIGMLARFAA